MTHNYIQVIEKEWESLTIANRYIFAVVMRDEMICRRLVELILPNVKVDHIQYLETEHTAESGPMSKGVRFDVYLRESDGRVIEIEMQSSDTKEIPKRSRYYSGMIDQQELSKGSHYTGLKDSFVIFLSFKVV